MSSKNMSSMRRKVIAEDKPNRDAARAALSQEELLTDISQKLDGVQAASEMSAESIEDKGNQILSGLTEVDGGIQDIVESTLLGAEAAEQTVEQVKSLTSISSRMSDKLSKLTELLASKVDNIQKASPESIPDDTLKAFEDSLPLPVVFTPDPEAPPTVPLPENDNRPDEDFFPPAPVDDKKKPGDDEKDNNMSKMLDGLLQTSKKGFKETVSITDKIAGMLFQYTVTALANTAKMVGMVFALVLAIDILKVHFEYWSKQFLSDFTAFSDKAKEWGGVLQSMLGSLEEIKKFWEAGDWSGLAGAIVKGLADVLYNLSELMSLGISKISAAILNALGFEGAALTVEGAALEGFQERTGSSLSDENQATLAAYQSKRIEEGETVVDKASKLKTQAWDWVRGRDNKDSMTEASDRESENAQMKTMAPEQRTEALMKQNEARAAMIRFEKYMGSVDPEDTKNVASMDKAYNDVKSKLASADLSKSPATKKELDQRFQKIDAKYKKIKEAPAPQPAPSQSSEDAQRVNNVEKAQAAEKANQQSKGKGDGTTLNNTNNVINKRTTVHNAPTITSTPAPGVFGATGV